VTDIDKLETLRAAATQGPFVHVPPPQGYSTGFIGYYVEHEGRRLRAEFPANEADDAYTVELLNAAPALLAELRRLRAIEAAAREVAAKWLANWGPMQHHREFVEAVKSLVAVFEKDTP